MEPQKKSRAENQAGKSVLVLSDSDLLFEVIEANLKQIYVKVDRVRPKDAARPSNGGSGHPCEPDLWQVHESVEQARVGDCDLIVVAVSSSEGEPIVALFNAALTGWIGQTPILIISERRFEACQEGRIFHLDFPFDSAELRRKVRALLACDPTRVANSPVRQGGTT